MTAVWMSAEEWMARRDRQRANERVQILGYQVPIRHIPPADHTRTNRPVESRYPRPPMAEASSPWPELRARIDRAVHRIRQEPKRILAGRRTALLEREDLAREVYQLVQQRGVNDALIQLDLSRQALHDTWKRHGWPAPIGAGNCTRKTA